MCQSKNVATSQGSSVGRCQNRAVVQCQNRAADRCQNRAVSRCRSRVVSRCQDSSAGTCLGNSAGRCRSSRASRCRSSRARMSARMFSGARCATTDKNKKKPSSGQEQELPSSENYLYNQTFVFNKESTMSGFQIKLSSSKKK